MPPDYESRSYWKDRFKTETQFEWLGDGSNTILPHIRSYLLQSCASGQTSPAHPPLLLHIGAGTSSFSERIRELYQNVFGSEVNEDNIVHADFVETLVARMQDKESKRSAGERRNGMRWICADAMKWGDLNTLLAPGDEGGRFELVVDKSTSDAISCGEDVSYREPESDLHPLINAHLVPGGRNITLVPVELLALHLASLVRVGGLWVSLSFSSNRFTFLSMEDANQTAPPHVAKCWAIEKVIAVDAPTGMDGVAHAPLVQHFVFLLRRRLGGD